MPFTNTPAPHGPAPHGPVTYGTVTKTFHWLIALAIVSMFPLGKIATDRAHVIETADPFPGEAFVAQTLTLFSIHKTLGVLIFLTALARILWTFTRPRPGLLHPDRRAEAFAAHLVHGLLYGGMVLVPLSGWLHHAATTGYAPLWLPFGNDLPGVPKDAALAEIFSQIHHLGILVLGAAVVLHIAGALKHHLIDRDGTLRRMLPFAAASGTPPAGARSLAPALAALLIWAGAIGAGAALAPPSATANAPAPAAAVASGGNWQVETGTLGLTVTQMNAPVSGSFADWSADITFDAAAPAGPAGEVTVRVSLASLTLGTVTDQAKGPDFLAAGTHPEAVYTATLHRLETGYEARGTLDLRGIAAPLSLPFTLEIDGDRAEMTGRARLDRRAHEVGGSVGDAATLGFDVILDVALTARKAP